MIELSCPIDVRTIQRKAKAFAVLFGRPAIMEVTGMFVDQGCKSPVWLRGARHKATLKSTRVLVELEDGGIPAKLDPSIETGARIVLR